MENLETELSCLPAKRGFSVSYKGKTLLSRIDPVAQGERLAAECPMEEKTLYFCPSPIYGYGISVLIGKLKPNSAILCVEADEKLFEISKSSLKGYLDLPKAGAKERPLALIKTGEAARTCAFVRETWGNRVFRRVKTIRLSGGWQLYPEIYDETEKALRREIAVEWGNAMTLIRLGRLYARNLIRNIALIPSCRDVSAVDFSSSPVLVLGAGPSLDFTLKELSSLFGGKIPRRDKRRFKIICVDTCLSALLEREIVSDLAVILESQHWNLEDFSGVRNREIDAAIDLSALPASARVLGGRRFLFATPWTPLALLKRLEESGLLPETLPPLGSVGLSAAALALRCGSGPVITAGIDFSYTLDSYHALSTPGNLRLERKQNRFRSLINAAAAFRDGSFPAIAGNGKAVRSDPSMRNYRDLFEREFGGESRLFSVNGTGLPLGVKAVSPEEAFSVLTAEPAGRPPALNGANETQCRKGSSSPAGVGLPPCDNERVVKFIRREIEALEALREILIGSAPPESLEELLDGADYLWAHFPECAGGVRRPPITDLGFLKRVRTEIEPFLNLWEMTLRELK